MGTHLSCAFQAAEHVTSVWMAMKGKMELTIGVSVGSSIQIAAGMIPILTLLAWPMGVSAASVNLELTH